MGPRDGLRGVATRVATRLMGRVFSRESWTRFLWFIPPNALKFDGSDGPCTHFLMRPLLSGVVRIFSCVEHCHAWPPFAALRFRIRYAKVVLAVLYAGRKHLYRASSRTQSVFQRMVLIFRRFCTLDWY